MGGRTASGRRPARFRLFYLYAFNTRSACACAAQPECECNFNESKASASASATVKKARKGFESDTKTPMPASRTVEPPVVGDTLYQSELEGFKAVQCKNR